MNLAYVPAKDHQAGSMRPVYPTFVAIDAMPEYNASVGLSKEQFAEALRDIRCRSSMTGKSCPRSS